MLARSFIHLIEAAKACEGEKKEKEGDRKREQKGSRRERERNRGGK